MNQCNFFFFSAVFFLAFSNFFDDFPDAFRATFVIQIETDVSDFVCFQIKER
jgi:hypothetical protein